VKLLPNHSVEYTLNCDLESANKHLSKYINTAILGGTRANDESTTNLFNGVLKEESFCISLRVEKSQSFLPLVNGRLIPYENKCLVLCTMSLFSSTKVFYLFWLAVTFLATVILLTYMALPAKALIAFLLLLANIVITNLSFDRQVKRTLTALDQVFNAQIK
jgi:hypothetical protein